MPYLPASRSICPFFFLSVYLSGPLSVCLSVTLHVCLPVSLFPCLSACLSQTKILLRPRIEMVSNTLNKCKDYGMILRSEALLTYCDRCCSFVSDRSCPGLRIATNLHLKRQTYSIGSLPILRKNQTAAASVENKVA